MKLLCKVTRECLLLGCEAAGKKGARIHDIGAAVSKHARKYNFGIVKDYCGHGVGLDVHEEPEIPNYVSKFTPNLRLRTGMVLAIEPMINMGTGRIKDNDPNGWTVRTADGKILPILKHTIAILENGMEILTKV